MMPRTPPPSMLRIVTQFASPTLTGLPSARVWMATIMITSETITRLVLFIDWIGTPMHKGNKYRDRLIRERECQEGDELNICDKVFFFFVIEFYEIFMCTYDMVDF